MQYAVKSQKHTATVAITAMIIIKRAALFMAARSLFLSRNGMVSGFTVHSRRQKLRVPCTKLERGLIKLSLADAAVEVMATAKGERILACLGELHLEQSILDLKKVYCGKDIELRISPLVG